MFVVLLFPGLPATCVCFVNVCARAVVVTCTNHHAKIITIFTSTFQWNYPCRTTTLLHRNQRAISDVLLGVWDAALLQALAGGAANNHDEQVGDGEGGAVATSGLGQWRRRSPHVGTRCVVLHNVKRKNPEYARTAEAHLPQRRLGSGCRRSRRKYKLTSRRQPSQSTRCGRGHVERVSRSVMQPSHTQAQRGCAPCGWHGGHGTPRACGGVVRLHCRRRRHMPRRSANGVHCRTYGCR